MTVKVTQPQKNVREGLSNTPKVSATVRPAGILSAYKNLLDNSSFLISQRGDYETTAQAVAGGTPTFAVDRWYTYANGSDTEQQIFNVVLPNGQHAKSLRTTLTGITTNTWLHPGTKIEPERWMRGQYITVSAWIRTNIPGYRWRVCDTITCAMIGDHIPSDGQWHYVTATHLLPEDMALHEDAVTNNIQIQPGWQDYGQNLTQNVSYIEFAQPQAEIGREATPFEHRQYQDDWTRCQRYYQRFGATDIASATDYTNFATAHGTNSAWYVPIVLPGGRMRIPPSLSFSAASDFRVTLQHSDSDPVTSIGYGYNNHTNPNLSVQAGSNGANRTRMFGWGGTTSAWLAFDAEWF